MTTLTYSTHPKVEICSNFFTDVPVILQYDDTPLIEVVNEVEAGYDIKIPIYHPDGTYLAKVVGSRLFLHKDGEKAGLTLRHPDKQTVCELDGKTLFEITRKGPAALKTSAELYTPDGKFVRCNDTGQPGLIVKGEDKLQVGEGTLSGNKFSGCDIGIWIKSDGSMAMGCKLPK